MTRFGLIKKIKAQLINWHIWDMLVFFYLLWDEIKKTIINRAKKLTGKTVPILLYHRVAKISNDPIKLVVSPSTFEKHIEYINKLYQPVSLSELSNRLQSGSIQGNEICVTFDDGYRDNLLNALPILEKYKTPATIFITTYRLGEQSSFDLDKLYKEEDRANFLSREEIKILSEHPLIEIGAHTHSHPRLSSLSEKEQKLEIETGKKILETITGKRILHFAYPFGSKRDFNKETRHLVKGLEFVSAYTNTGLLSTTSSDEYSFPRMNIRESSVKELSQKLCNN